MTQKAITQVETEFETIRLRLKSLDRRMQNVISLVSTSLFYMEADHNNSPFNIVIPFSHPGRQLTTSV
jgi:hypothetical protein